MRLRSYAMAIAAIAWSMAPGAAEPAQPVVSQSARPAPDPNQRICEDVTQVGSRLATKRICATRSEWAAMRKADRETVDQAQRSANIGCSTVGSLSSTPTC